MRTNKKMSDINRKSLSVSIPPWDLPLKEFVKTFPMSVAIFDKHDIVIHEEVIDYGNPDDRRKLGKMTYWACNEGHTVETSAVKA